ncbi:MAG: tetratricopeptide repeat protein [Chloroflexaceae bacterium]
MAEPDSILQLGIEAARDNKKEEARQLFRLLTRQEPTNVQGWLWLAGVAENREERQAALERVLELDPDNEMAFKGLKALGVTPAVAAPPASAEPVPAPPVEEASPAAISAAAAHEYEDDAFAELDSLSEAIAADTSGPVRRAESAAEAEERAAAAAGGAGAAATGGARPAAGPRQAPSRPSSNRPSRRPARSVEEDELEPARSGISLLLALLIFLVLLGLIWLLIAFLFPQLFGGTQVAGTGTAQTAAALTAQAGPAPTAGAFPGGVGQVTPATEASPVAPPTPGAEGVPTTEGAPGVLPAPTTEGPPVTEVTAPAPPTPPADVSGANPAIVPANTPLQSEGWLYDFNQPTFAASIVGNLGQYEPENGRFAVVLAFVVNNTGTAQPVPPSFFVLKDAQGRVWEARPEVSAAYVVPGVNADLAHTQSLPPDGITRSVAIIFDVAPDATDLVFFARGNPGQGWLVLRSL